MYRMKEHDYRIQGNDEKAEESVVEDVVDDERGRESGKVRVGEGG